MPRSLSKEELTEFWDFSSNGFIIWKKNYFKQLVGTSVTCKSSLGYTVVSHKGAQYKVHRLIYAYHTGKWPRLIDHINGNPSDNRIENLREVTFAQNSANTQKSSGKINYRGVSMFKNRYRAFIQAKGKREFLGYFDTAELAKEAYDKRRSELNPGLIL